MLIRTYIYPFAVIVGVVGGSNRSAVNLKQCSKRGMNDGKEYGLILVSTFAHWNNSNVGATNINISPSVFSTFAEYANHCIYCNTLLDLSLSVNCIIIIVFSMILLHMFYCDESNTLNDSMAILRLCY